MLGPKIKGYFTLLNPKAMEWVATESTKLINDTISEPNKELIRQKIQEEFLEGYGPAALARRILPLVGLTEPLATAVENYYAGLKKKQEKGEKSLTDERIGKLYAAYALRLRRYRARVIARTETTAASNAGQRAMWQAAADQGYLDLSQSVRRWILTYDDRLCPICKLMKGQEVPVDKPFKTPDGGSIEGPPLHPQCRCGQGLAKVQVPPLPKEEKLAPLPPPPPKIAAPGTAEWLADMTSISMSLEGAHAKQVYQDKAGNRWMFKPDEASALAEIAGYNLMRELGLAAPEVYLIMVGGKIGTIQRMWADVAGPVRTNALHALTKEQLEEIQAHQVADWAMSQHDTNDGALILSQGGQVYAIDKGQALKFVGKDKLDWAYNPNPNALVYNRLFEDHIAGHITLDRAAIQPTLRKLETLSDARLREIFRPYAEHAVQRGLYRIPDDLLDQLIARKASIRADFEDLYDRADAARARRLGQATPKGAHTKLDDAFAADVRRQGWAGRSIMVAGPDFEDAHLLAYEVKQGANRTLVLEAKIRESAEGKILQAMGTPAAAAPRSHPEDRYWNGVLNTIKHVQYHLKPGSPGKDGIINPQKVKILGDVATDILAKTSPANALEYEAMLTHYSQLIQKVTGKYLTEIATASLDDLAQWVKAAYDPATVAEQYQISVKKNSPASMSPDRIQAVREKPWQYARTHENGEIVASTAKDVLHGETGYTLDLGGGMTGVYIQHGDENKYSKMGRLTIYRENYQGSAREIADTLDQFKRLGMEAKLATKEDLEVVYLHKQAHAMKLEDDAGWNAARNTAEAASTTAERLRILKEFFNGRLGVADVSKLNAYHPDPEFDRGWNPSAG
ncbi:MAG: phage minor head protein, partial [Coriobacteriia bacterium]